MRCLAVLATLTVVVAPAAAQDAKAERAARAHYQKGAQYFKARQYAKALVEYRAAYRLVQQPALLFNIARALHENGDQKEALEHYRRYLAEAPSGPVADEAREFAASLERALAPAPVEPAAPPPEPTRPPPAPVPEPAAPTPPRIEPASPPGGAATTTIAEPVTVVRRSQPGRLRGGGLAGLTVSGIAYDAWHGGTRLGLAAGGFGSYRILPAFGLRLEAAYLQKGTGDDPDFGKHWHADFVQLGLLAEALVTRVHVGLGPYAALRVSADSPFEDQLESVDVGLLAGAGVTFPVGPGDLTIDLRYEHGLTSLKATVDANNRTFVIAVGYASR